MKKTTGKTMEPKKRKGSPSRNKGARAETELVAILNELGVNTQRVISSGAIKDAKGDIKLGVDLKEDGTFPGRDEGVAKLRGECKNRKDFPEWVIAIFNELEQLELLGGVPERGATEIMWKHLEQSDQANCVFLKRQNTPSGVLKNKDYNKAYLVYMGLEDWVKLFKKAYGIP